MIVLYRQETTENKEIFINPLKIESFELSTEENMVFTRMASGDIWEIKGDYFATMMNESGMDIIPIRGEEEIDDSDVNNTEYKDESPLEEPGQVLNFPFDPDNLMEDRYEELEPEQFEKETEEDYLPKTNAQVES